MVLLAISFPEFSGNGYKFIQEIRQQHDSNYTIIEPHITLVFPIDGMEVHDFISEIKKQALGLRNYQYNDQRFINSHRYSQ